jgi:ATP-dependent DNA helicase DinG
MTAAEEKTDALLNRLREAMGSSGEDRPGQHEMAHATATAIVKRRHLVVQAGTGTGKSLAYLAAAVAMGKRVVIATATKALQDQLAQRDLPFVAAHAGRTLTWAVLKGRSNYVCLQRLDEVTADEQETLSGLGSLPTAEIRKIQTWAETTATGDRADLEIDPSVSAWSAVSVGPRECPGASKCPRGDDCFAETARRRADTADVVVVNTHLYGLHLAAGRSVLGDHDVLVVDEAHELPEIVSSTAGLELGRGRFTNVARMAASILAEDELCDSIDTIGERIANAMSPYSGERLVGTLTDKLTELSTIASGRLVSVMEAVRKIEAGGNPELETRKARVLTATTALAGDLQVFIDPPDDAVIWVEGETDAPVVKLAPLDVGITLDDLLWNPKPGERDRRPGGTDDGEAAADGWDNGETAAGGAADRHGIPQTVILTSATIPHGLATQLHLPPELTDVIDVGTPFDFANNGLLYCAAQLPDPRADNFREKVNEELAALIKLAGGRTLALFTSYRAMNESAEALADRVDYELLVQGQLPKPKLVERFANEETSLLFATMGYWQGIDIPGSALSLVTIDRIPFPRPNEPLWEARREAAGRNAFSLIDVPRAAMLLAQGAGRLIRTKHDRGVVAVLDPRLATAKSYRWQLINALPPFPRTSKIQEVADFFNREP